MSKSIITNEIESIICLNKQLYNVKKLEISNKKNMLLQKKY